MGKKPVEAEGMIMTDTVGYRPLITRLKNAVTPQPFKKVEAALSGKPKEAEGMIITPDIKRKKY